MSTGSARLLEAEIGPGATIPRLPRIIMWFRRDLRVEDNPALTAALDLAEEVVRFLFLVGMTFS